MNRDVNSLIAMLSAILGIQIAVTMALLYIAITLLNCT